MNLCCWLRREWLALWLTLRALGPGFITCDDCGNETEPTKLFDNGHDVYAICGHCWPRRGRTFGA